MKKNLLPYGVLLLCLLLNIPGRAATITPVKDSIELVVENHLKDFRNLPKKERKARLKEARKIWKEQVRHPQQSDDGEIVFLAILAVLLPPLAVVLKENKVTKRFWICLLLSLLFLLPGIVYALLIVFGVIQ